MVDFTAGDVVVVPGKNGPELCLVKRVVGAYIKILRGMKKTTHVDTVTVTDVEKASAEETAQYWAVRKGKYAAY